MLVALLVVPSLQTMSKVFRNTRKVTFSEVLIHYLQCEAQEISLSSVGN